MPSSSTTAPSGALHGKEVIDLLKKIVGREEGALAEVQKLLPHVEEETESDQLKQQQKLLNQIRKIQTRIGKKEMAVQQKEQQMQQFIQQIRQHVDSETLRHKKEVEQIQSEIADLKQQLQKVKAGKSTEDINEEEIEDAFMEDEEKTALRKQLDEANREQASMRQQVAYMQQQMDTFMLTYNATMKNQPELVPPNALSPRTPNQPVKVPINMMADGQEAPKVEMTRDAKAPFGVRAQCKAAREAASPYAVPKGPDSGMD